MKIEEVDIDSLKPASYNPRNIDFEEMESLKRSLKQFGFVDPAIIRKKDNMIIGGHQRIEAAKALGWETAPVIIMDVSANDAKLLNVALNKISGDWDDVKLANLLKELKYDNSVDELLTGFTEEELDTLLWDLGQDDLDEELREEDPDKLDTPEVYDERDVRVIVLSYPLQDYEGITARFDELVKEFEVESYSDVVIQLLERHE
jgi:ParB-like chromosome segregation protein Spo0J